MTVDTTYQPSVVAIRQDGNMQVPSGNFIEVGNGAAINLDAGSTLNFQGSPIIQGAAFNRNEKTVAIVLTGGVDTGGGIGVWQNLEIGNVQINGALLYVSTVATGACSLIIGTTATNATTTSNNLLDTIDVHSAIGLFDNFTDKGTNGKSRQTLATGKWVTVSTASGASAGLVGILYITYITA